ncbi:MAG: hypothetical protein JO142_02010 [Burkholderiales bacterium]|nr:hypothetical protein [Burkholderiales bacterium]
MARLISLTDAQKRDAQVMFESARATAESKLRQVGPQGESVRLERLIKATENTSLDALLRQHGSLENISAALVAGDPEIALDQVGRRLRNAARVYLRKDGAVLYAARVMQVVFGPDGIEKSRQEFSDTPATVGEEATPLPWTGRLMAADEVVHKFVFSRSFQIRHVNGLTFDFLYDIAKHLHEAGKLLYVGSGAKGQGPLIFVLNGTPFRGFLEGRIDGDGYLLVLHCSNLEMKAMPQ